MIKLIDLLKEINDNNNEIYHFTSYSSCQKIINYNKLLSNKADMFFEYDGKRILSGYKNVIFFTIEKERFSDEGPSNECILIIDKQKLSKDYKVIAYGDPYEETVLYTNDPFIPVLPYLKGVILKNTLEKSKVKKFIPFLEEKNIPYHVDNTLEKSTKERQSKLPQLKKEFINRLKLKYPNGFIGYLNEKLYPLDSQEKFKKNPTYSYPNITINRSGKIGRKNKFQIQFDIKPQNYEKYINWYLYSPKDIEELINMDSYEGVELGLKGDIKIG